MNRCLPCWLLQTVQKLRLLIAGLSAGLLIACGGGDDTARYQSVAMNGELIDFVIDTVQLTYNYAITESQFGLSNKTGSGTLTLNDDGSYTPSGAPDSRLVVRPNGIMLGSVRERFGSDEVTVPLIGVKDPALRTAELAAEYNYVQHSCLSAQCSVSHGTLRINALGTWMSCRDGDIAAGACTGTTANGTLEPRDQDGLWRLRSSDGTDIGTAIGYNRAGENVLVVDLKDQRAGGFGIGMLVGGQQASMTSTVSDGAWIAAMSSGQWIGFTASGRDIVLTQFDWAPVNIGLTFAANDPWSGMATTAWGDVGFIVGAGVYMLKTPSGDVELGVKVR